MVKTVKSFSSREQLNRHKELYLSIGYLPKTRDMKRLPNRTKHKLVLNYDHELTILYHL